MDVTRSFEPTNAGIVRAASLPVVVSWLLFLVFSLFFYALTAASPLLGETTWPDAARAATGLWLTSYGGNIQIAGSVLGVMPGSIVVLNVLASIRSARSVMQRGELATGWVQTPRMEMSAERTVPERRGNLKAKVQPVWIRIVAFAAIQAAIVAIIGLIVRPGGTWWYAIFGAFFIGLAAAAYCSAQRILPRTPLWAYTEPIVPWVRRVLVGFILMACAVFALAGLSGLSRILDIHHAYFAGISGGIGLALLQLLYLPNFIVWAGSWVLGAGFSINDAFFAIYTERLHPIPGIPVFGAIPPYHRWYLAFAIVPLLLCGLMAWRYVKTLKTRERGTMTEELARIAALALACGFASAIAAFMASGRMGGAALTGAVPWMMLLCVMGWILIAFIPAVAWTVRSCNSMGATPSAGAHVVSANAASSNSRGAATIQAVNNATREAAPFEDTSYEKRPEHGATNADASVGNVSAERSKDMRVERSTDGESHPSSQ